MRADALARALAQLDTASAKRTRRVWQHGSTTRPHVEGRGFVSFASNDYLGLSNHPRVVEALISAAREFGAGAGASHLVSGHHDLHEALERKFAHCIGAPRALLFSSGYAANLGTLTAFADRASAIFADKLNHACLNDGALLSRAEFVRYRHGDVTHLASLLAQSKASDKLIASDAVFSMDGDIADVPQLLELAMQHDAVLVLDDAHGFGVLGERGLGTLEHFGMLGRPWPARLMYMATLGKALGVAGAVVAGSAEAIDWLTQRARPYVFSTASPPALAAAASAALDVLHDEPQHVQRLHAHIAAFRRTLEGAALRVLPSRTAIQPIVYGDNDAALAAQQQLAEAGLWVPAIRPPTVPTGTARLRVSLSAAHDDDDIARLVAALRA